LVGGGSSSRISKSCRFQKRIISPSQSVIELLRRYEKTACISSLVSIRSARSFGPNDFPL
jgi:hypothetical protein